MRVVLPRRGGPARARRDQRRRRRPPDGRGARGGRLAPGHAERRRPRAGARRARPRAVGRPDHRRRPRALPRRAARGARGRPARHRGVRRRRRPGVGAVGRRRPRGPTRGGGHRPRLGPASPRGRPRVERFIDLRFRAFAFVTDFDVDEALGPGPHDEATRARTRDRLRADMVARAFAAWKEDARQRVAIASPGRDRPVASPLLARSGAHREVSTARARHRSLARSGVPEVDVAARSPSTNYRLNVTSGDWPDSAGGGPGRRDGRG